MALDWEDRFTAAGKPMPFYKEPTTWERSCPWGPQAPLHPPFRFTDESIIPVMVRVQQSECEIDERSQRPERRTNIFQRTMCWLKGTGASHPHAICVFMPRGDYLKHFAHDDHGNYIGSEVQRSWSEKELDAKFGKYQDYQPLSWARCEEEGKVFMSEEVKKGEA